MEVILGIVSMKGEIATAVIQNLPVIRDVHSIDVIRPDDLSCPMTCDKNQSVYRTELS